MLPPCCPFSFGSQLLFLNENYILPFLPWTLSIMFRIKSQLMLSSQTYMVWLLPISMTSHPTTSAAPTPVCFSLPPSFCLFLEAFLSVKCLCTSCSSGPRCSSHELHMALPFLSYKPQLNFSLLKEVFSEGSCKLVTQSLSIMLAYSSSLYNTIFRLSWFVCWL